MLKVSSSLLLMAAGLGVGLAVGLGCGVLIRGSKTVVVAIGALVELGIAVTVGGKG